MKLNKKWEVHVIQNAHTDLGYTHRQEYIFRAHHKYIERVVDIIDKNPDYKWTIETYWMVENFKNRTSDSYFNKFQKYVKSGNIEISTNYLNMLNIVDSNAIKELGKKINDNYPGAQCALLQDVNSLSLANAKSMSETGTKNLFVSVHSHHGMFVGDAKQRGFLWDLGNESKMVVWIGEHYMLGNELFFNQQPNHKYTFKDDIESFSHEGFEQGIIRLKNYLKLLEDEGYPFSSVPIVISGVVIDNSPPNVDIINGIKKLNAVLKDEINIKMSNISNFFKEIDISKFPTLKGEWTSWWVDGAISTPEEVRLYRESQKIYKIILEWNNKNRKLDEDKIKILEKNMLLFSEHTWGSWSSQSNPFSNGNNLLFARKRGMVNKASELAWELLDEIKEIEGYEIIKLKNDKSFKIINPYNETLEKVISFTIPLEISKTLLKDRYVLFEDVFEIIDDEGRSYKTVIAKNMGGMENINTNIDSDETIMIKIRLRPFERKKVFLKLKKAHYKPFVSSKRLIGIENEDDIFCSNLEDEIIYNRNGLENNFYRIIWNDSGIISIFDKNLKEELINQNKSIRPIYIKSNGDSRRKMGRNRQGPSNKVFKGKIFSHKVDLNKGNVKIISLHFELEGTKKFQINISLTNLDKNIRIETLIQKTNEFEPENLYLDLPFKKDKDILVNTQSGFFRAWKDQLTNSNIDYCTFYNGFLIKNKKYDVALFSPDCPILQLGSLDFKRRKLMGMELDILKSESMIWLMTNYWETNYKGTLEGNYKFNFEINSSIDSKNWLKDSHKSFIGFPIYKKEF